MQDWEMGRGTALDDQATTLEMGRRAEALLDPGKAKHCNFLSYSAETGDKQSSNYQVTPTPRAKRLHHN